MANTYQQLAQQRKLIYAILIVSLFTLSLVHKKYVIEPQAFDLQLRESSRGEVELTSSAIRLTLTGSRGFATTILWSAAMKKQMKHEYNELELLVNSIMKLQPYFITPWRYQGWNLAFNVSVECDRPVDKYYYISRGFTLLAEGERRNQGAEAQPGQPVFPGNPDLRRDVGFYYSLKIGGSDEKYTMRCLLDMSCIDPVRRQFAQQVQSKRTPALDKQLREELASFGREYPMFVRRLVDHVDCDSERKVLQFLNDNSELPTRFKPLADPSQKQSVLKEPNAQFPILPRHESDWPDPTSYQLTNEQISVYLMSRTWYQYAQKPLPPVANYFDEASKKQPAAGQKYRPSLMLAPVFRIDPCRAQAYIAETREEEGWFDGEGWSPESWSPTEFWSDVVLGTGYAYKAAPLWGKAYGMYYDYGVDNGLLLTDSRKKMLEGLARQFEKEHNIGTDEPADKKVRSDQMGPGYHAHELLRQHHQFRQVTNYDAHLYKCDAERDPLTVLARKIYYKAENARKTNPREAIALYDQAEDIFMDVLLQYPKFAKDQNGQEDTYEAEIDHVRLVQRENPAFFRAVMMGTAEMIAQWPFVPIPWSAVWTHTDPKTQEKTTRKFLSDAERIGISKIRNVRGPFSTTRYYDAPHAQEVKDALFMWSAGAQLFPLSFYPYEQNRLLSKRPVGEITPPPNWRYLVEDTAVRAVRQRRNYPELGK